MLILLQGWLLSQESLVLLFCNRHKFWLIESKALTKVAVKSHTFSLILLVLSYTCILVILHMSIRIKLFNTAHQVQLHFSRC